MSCARKMSQFILEISNKTSVRSCGSRLGHVTLGGEEYPTPAFFIHTLVGSVPHITAEVLDYIFPPNDPSIRRPPLQVSIDSTMVFHNSLANFGKGIGKFVGLPDSPVFLTVHNPSIPLRGGHNDKNGIAMWSRTGKTTLPLNTFQKIIAVYKPAVFQGLSDYDICKSSTLKRTRKSTQRALEYLEGLTNSEKSQNPKGLFVTIESCWFSVDQQEAEKTLALILEKLDQIEGFVISGLTSSPIQKLEREKEKAKSQSQPDGSGKKSPQPQVLVEEIDYTLLENIVAKLPEHKPRYVPGPLNPRQIAELVSRGVDLFDSSFVTQLAGDGRVLDMEKFDREFLHKAGVENETLPERYDNDNDGIEFQKNADENEKSSILISLRDKRYFDDFSPVSKTCSCYTCRKHTKAYINHLYATDELLGPVLTMIHNLTSFDKLFKAIRRNLKNEDNVANPTFQKLMQALS